MPQSSCHASTTRVAPGRCHPPPARYIAPMCGRPLLGTRASGPESQISDRRCAAGPLSDHSRSCLAVASVTPEPALVTMSAPAEPGVRALKSESRFDPICMVRSCGARGFVDPGDAVLHQCIRPVIGAYAPGHHGYQRACDLISGQASNGLLGSPVFARAGQSPSRCDAGASWPPRSRSRAHSDANASARS
jgi:hypothetical protein